jgi:hypothetical protein
MRDRGMELDDLHLHFTYKETITVRKYGKTTRYVLNYIIYIDVFETNRPR